ncbi:hypothetical protein V1477_018225 [Vespula maculifrons]|uniref:Uncharacterized protein n=1 Tax=Vespula maculifrons TaxID=7453 RepID=A0ABD2AYV3_VESMC
MCNIENRIQKKREKGYPESIIKHMDIDVQYCYTLPKPEYENRARFCNTERRPAQKPTPKGPSQGTHPRETIIINLE